MDESYNDRIFTLSWIVAEKREWKWLSLRWVKCIDRWNRRLKSQGRRQISRYHAADCSNRLNEFSGWSSEEQKELTTDLIRIVGGFTLDSKAFSLDLREFHNTFPDARRNAKPDQTGFIYGMLTKFLLFTVANHYGAVDPDARVSIIHDRCPYDGVMQDAFNQVLNDPTFEHPDFFTTIESHSWQKSIPLQLADMLAYENFKDTMRHLFPRNQRKSMQMLIDCEKLGLGWSLIAKDALLDLKKYLENGQTREDSSRSGTGAE